MLGEEHVESGGEVANDPTPAGCERVLTAKVAAFPLAEILGWIHSSEKSGLLSVSHLDHQKAVYFRNGEVVFASSNQRVDRLGECLLRAGVITVEQLRCAEKRFDPTGRFGKALVEQGFLTPPELWKGVKDQVEEVVRSLSAYSDGTVQFFQGDVEPDNVVRLSLPTERLVNEGLQRRRELRKFVSVLQDPRVKLVPVAAAGRNLAKAERALFDALDAGGSFPETCQKLDVDPLTAARTVQFLRLVGAVKLIRDDSDDRGGHEADRDGAIRACLETHGKLLAELAAPIVAVAGAAGLRLRLGGVIEDLRLRHPMLLDGEVFGPGISLDAELLAERARELGENALPELSDALGELVTYLEFELKNHPHIDQPEFYLDRLAELRATISP